MRRVTVPLAAMGARFTEQNGDGLPLTVRGERLRPLRYEMPVSSAQIKSAILLAGHGGRGGGRAYGSRTAALATTPSGCCGRSATAWPRKTAGSTSRPGGDLEPFDIQVPGDPSSAAFLVGAAVLAGGGRAPDRRRGGEPHPDRLPGGAWAEWGPQIQLENESDRFGEPVGDLVVRPAALRGTEVAAGEIPGLIDEIPLLAVLASRASGTTTFRQVGELRVKESDRLGPDRGESASGGCGGRGGGRRSRGGGNRSRSLRAARCAPPGDHRLAMAFAVLGTVPGRADQIDDMACAGGQLSRISSRRCAGIAPWRRRR